MVATESPTVGKRAVRILLECFLVYCEFEPTNKNVNNIVKIIRDTSTTIIFSLYLSVSTRMNDVHEQNQKQTSTLTIQTSKNMSSCS